MQLANVEVILALEQGQVKQAQLLIERLRQRARPLFEKSRSAGAADHHRGPDRPTIELDGLEERLGWALGMYDQSDRFLCPGTDLPGAHPAPAGRPKEALASLGRCRPLASRNRQALAQAMAEEINLILQDSGPDRLKRAEQRLKSVD